MALLKKQIIFQPGNCLNLKKPYPRECRLCIQFCPHDAINEKKEISKEKCTECGVCMSVCPSDGFIDKDMDILGSYLFEAPRIVLNCPLAEPQGYEISCLGMLDRDAWTTLLLLATSKEVTILTGDCGKCDDRQACAVSVAFLKDLLQANHNESNIKIQILPANEGPDKEEYIDKNLLQKKKDAPKTGLRQQGKNAIRNLLSNIEEEQPYHTPKTREWFAQAISGVSGKKIPYKALKVNDKCTSCGVCAKICPQNALQQVQKDGKIKLIYEPKSCVQCSRCVDICGPKAMKLEYVDFTDKFLNGKILIKESVAKFCIKCGKQIYHNSEPQLCMPCASKDPSLKGVLF